MIHHRHVTGGSQPQQSTSSNASNSNCSSSFIGRSHQTNGSDQGALEAAAAAAAPVDGLVGGSVTPAGAGAPNSGARRENPWHKKAGRRRKVAFVAAIGTLALLVACERLTSILGSPARSNPVSRLDGRSNADGTPRRRDTVAGAATDWIDRVAGCTGPADGFVYGGDGTGRVLTFVRKGRSEDAAGSGGGGSGVGGDGPALPDVLKWFWKLKHDRGVLAYEVAELEERRDVGSETGWEVVFASNLGRHKPFPPAGPAEAPWDPSSFNFYKASPSEFLLSYTPSFRHESDGSRASVGKVGVAPMAGDAAAGEAAAAAAAAVAAGEANSVTLVALRGAGSDLNLGGAAAAAAGSYGDSPLGCAEVSNASPPQDAVLVNIRPVGPVSLLLTPGYPHSHNQRAAAGSLAIAMDFAEALRVDPGFRLGFNSAGSSASVNHLHFQCWYFDAGPGGLAIEASKSVHAATVPLRRRSPAEGAEEEAKGAVEVHTLDGYPIRTLVFHTLGTDLEAVGEVIERCVDFLVEENTPHTLVFSTGRAFLLPRQHLEEPPFAVVPGFPEVSGEIIVTKEEDFRTITADHVFEWWRDKIGVSAEHFDRIVDGCLK